MLPHLATKNESHGRTASLWISSWISGTTPFLNFLNPYLAFMVTHFTSARYPVLIIHINRSLTLQQQIPTATELIPNIELAENTIKNG